MVDHYAMGAPLYGGSFRETVRDIGVKMGHRAEQQLWKAGIRHARCFAGQPLQTPVFAHVDHGMGVKNFSEPQIKSSQRVVWRQISGMNLLRQGG